jgi:hypothetical protein
VSSLINPLIPAKAGTQAELEAWMPRVLIPHALWVPGFAGMSGGEGK